MEPENYLRTKTDVTSLYDRIRQIISGELALIIQNKPAYLSNGEADRIASRIVQAVEERKPANEDEADFFGEGYDPVQDKERLTESLYRVFAFMMRGGWYTQFEIAEGSDTVVTTVRTYLSNLRRPEWGGHTVLRTRVEEGKGTYKYQLVPNKESKTYQDYLSRRG